MSKWNLLATMLLGPLALIAQNSKPTHADTLRGSNGPARHWWNITHYAITVDPDYNSRSIRGTADIRFAVTRKQHAAEMQLDLQAPMILDSVVYQQQSLRWQQDGNAYLLNLQNISLKDSVLHCYFHGTPRAAVRPPWDGGWIWSKDKAGNPWISVACQGLGASVWYPCKDYQGDEPDLGASLLVFVPDTLQAIANGRLVESGKANGKNYFKWAVQNPINNYNIVPYIGKYSHWHETYTGAKGPLDMDYWVLPANETRARTQFKDAARMMQAFEWWFGPYPFYEDGYKLIEAPHLGMEHQSAIAYGNGYTNGYRGTDLSGSGWGNKWDFIIVHESGHEWFANNITTNDIADMWVHEGFTNYSETLFTEYFYGKTAATDYIAGIRKLIQNDAPIIGTYGVNKEGSGDMYYKGGNLIHLIRQLMQNDSSFRLLLHDLNQHFYHQTVDGSAVEKRITAFSGLKLKPVFDQYLRDVRIPTLEYRLKANKLQYRWTNCIPGFRMAVKITADQQTRWLNASTKWKTLKQSGLNEQAVVEVDRNFYVLLKRS